MQNILDVSNQTTGVYKSDGSYSYELALSLCKSGEFLKSIPYLKESKNKFIKNRNFTQLVICYRLLFDACYHQQNFEEMRLLKEEFESVCEEFNITEKAPVLAAQAYYSIINHEEKDYDLALINLKKALTLSLDEQEVSLKEGDRIRDFKAKLDIMNCLYIYSVYYFKTDQKEKSIKELESIDFLLNYYYGLQNQLNDKKSQTDVSEERQFLDKFSKEIQYAETFIKRLELSILYLRALIEEDKKKSETLLWKAYEQANLTKNTYLIPYIFSNLVEIYMKQGDVNQASVFLNLAERNLDKENFKVFHSKISLLREKLNELNTKEITNYDIILNEESYSIVEKDKGCVNFKSQFILWEMLKLLFKEKGISHSKQSLVEKVWNQDYSPMIHDNKIYVTVKRLRELVEPDSNRPKYICRNKDGYYVKDKVNVLFK